MKKFYILLPFLLAVSTYSQAQWSGAFNDTLTWNNDRDEVSHQCFDYDSQGDLHLLYMRESGGTWFFYYQRKIAGLGWAGEEPVTNQVGNSPVLGAHPWNGEVYVAYIQPMATYSEVFLHSKSLGVWTTQRVTVNGTDDYSPTIDVDGNGVVHLAWIGQDSLGLYKIFYGNNFNGNWNIQMLTGSLLGPFGTGAFPVIAVSPTGTAHIAYRGGDFGTYRIQYATNSAFNSNSWDYDTLITPNAEDFTASIFVSQTDTTVHLLTSGNDGWGFPVHAYYTKRVNSSGPFIPAVAVAAGLSAEVGDLFVDDNTGNPHCVLNEVSGNFYTGNIIYANEATNWQGNYLINNQGSYNADMLIDENGRGHCAFFAGNTFQTEEIVVFGPSSGIGINEVPENSFRIYPNPFSDRLTLDYSSGGSPHCVVEVIDAFGKTVITPRTVKGLTTFDLPDLSSGLYSLKITSREDVWFKKLVKVQ